MGQIGRQVTVVTGPMRSGTSCVTGLLELLGFDLGRRIRVLRDATEHNPKGHFETDLLHTINSRLISEVPGGVWSLLSVPDGPSMGLLSEERDRYFKMFIDRFDGDLVKDPLMCLTIGFWQQRWPELRRAVFCLRNPLAVARSMQKRYMVSIERGVELWHLYTTRFLDAVRSREIYVLDFDGFVEAPVDSLLSLLRWLERPTDRGEVVRHLSGFYSSEHVHWSLSQQAEDELPPPVADLYGRMRAGAGSWEGGRP